MASTTENATKALTDTLQPGEQVIAATKAMLEGGTMAIAKNVAYGNGIVWVPGDGGDVSQQLVNGAILVATDRRLIIMSATATAFKPKKTVLEIDRPRISGTTIGEKKIMFVKMPTFVLEIDTDGEASSIAFEIPKAARKDFEAVASALGA